MSVPTDGPGLACLPASALRAPAPRQSLPHRGPTPRCCGCLAWCGHQGRVLSGTGTCGACPSGRPTLLHLLCAQELTCTGLIWGSGGGREEREDVSPSCFLQKGLSLHRPKRHSGSQFWKLPLQPLRAEGDETSQPRPQGLVSPPVPTSIPLTCHQVPQVLAQTGTASSARGFLWPCLPCSWNLGGGRDGGVNRGWARVGVPDLCVSFDPGPGWRPPSSPGAHTLQGRAQCWQSLRPSHTRGLGRIFTSPGLTGE